MVVGHKTIFLVVEVVEQLVVKQEQVLMRVVVLVVHM